MLVLIQKGWFQRHLRQVHKLKCQVFTVDERTITEEDDENITPFRVEQMKDDSKF